MFQTEAGQEPWLQSVNPIVVMALCSLLAVVLLALHRSFPIPTFLPVGLGFLLLGGGLLVSVAGTSLPVLIASTALIAAGESFAAPFFAARLASGVNWRVAPVLLAALTASTWAVNEAASPASEIGGGVLAAIGILACLVGVALMPLAGILERALYGDPERPAR